MTRIVLSHTALLSLLVAVPAAQAAPAVPAPPPPAAPELRITVEEPNSCTQVVRRGRQTQVTVCQRTRQRAAAPAPVAPPPPPAPPAQTLPPPPPLAPSPGACRAPTPVPAPATAPRAQPAPKPLLDPARTHLGFGDTAEVLGHGEWDVVSRGIVGLAEINVGLGGRFQLGFKTSPLTWFAPWGGTPLKDSLWMFQVKAQFVRTRLFKMTAELSYLHVAILHGLISRLTAKIGNDRVAFHAGAGVALGWFREPVMVYDAQPGPSRCASSAYTDCGGAIDESSSSAPQAIVGHANLGLEVRFWRYGKFFVDSFVAGPADGPPLMGAVPGVRFHGKGFAADIGLGALWIPDETVVPLPVLNFSYRW